MIKIAFLGTGAMGSRMAMQLLQAGHSLTVWNRDGSRTAPLVQAGAQAASSPRQAAATADIVISMLRDDAASEHVWCDDDTGAIAGMKPGSIAIECSTLSKAWVDELAQRLDAVGCPLLDAPVAGSRPQAEAGQLIFLVGGAASAVETAATVLEAMAAGVHHAGGVGSGACIKLAVNALFSAQLAVLAELLGALDRAGVDLDTAVELIRATPVCSPVAGSAGEAMLAQCFTPMFPIELVTKDLAYASGFAADGDVKSPLIDACHQVFSRACDEGYADDNINAVVQLYR